MNPPTTTVPTTNTNSAATNHGVEAPPPPPKKPTAESFQRKDASQKRGSPAATAATNRHGKSRPGSLAQMHLALLKHMETQKANANANIDDEALRRILQDQSGSKAHHEAHEANPRDAIDPLCHLLTVSSACGAGTEPPVFRHDKANLGIRMAPELLLLPILEELRLLKQAWTLMPTQQQQQHTAVTWNPAVTHQSREQERMSDLRAPCGNNNNRIKYASARPLW